MTIQPVSTQLFDYRLTPHLSLLKLFDYFVRAVEHRLRNLHRSGRQSAQSRAQSV